MFGIQFCNSDNRLSIGAKGMVEIIVDGTSITIYA